MTGEDVRERFHGEAWLIEAAQGAVSVDGETDGDDRLSRLGPSDPIDLPARGRVPEPVNEFSGPTYAATEKRWKTASLGVACIVTAVLTGTVVAAVLDHRPTAEATVTVPSTVTASTTTATTTPSASPLPMPACRGLSAPTITAGPGDSTTLAGVVAAFEYAYYVRRDVDAALQVTDPRAGLRREVLAAAIAALPTGTTHCVAITPVTDGTVDVHLVELHPDGTRFDYLQLVNTTRAATGPDPAGLVIANIQRRGN